MPKFCLEINASDRQLKARLDAIAAHLVNLERMITMNQAETAQALRDVKAQLDKATAEIVAKVAALEEAVANGGASTPEIDAAVADLKAIAQRLDDLNVDPAPAPPPDPIP